MHYLLNKQLAQVKITAHFEVTFKQFFENLNTVVFSMKLTYYCHLSVY